jgi:hypothetical protein
MILWYSPVIYLWYLQGFQEYTNNFTRQLARIWYYLGPIIRNQQAPRVALSKKNDKGRCGENDQRLLYAV